MSAAIRALALWLALMPAAFAGENPASVFFANLAGDWYGKGEVSGMTADMRMSWEAVLDGQFQRLTLDNQMSGADGKSWHFKAQAYYGIAKDGSIAGTWFDSRGISQPLAGDVDQDTMTILWGSETTERGRSTYQLAADSLDVTDEVLAKEGEWRVFGRARLARLP